MDRTILAVMVKLREALQEQAEAAVRFPKEEPFHHGVQAGIWQGLDKALSIVTATVEEKEEEEARL